MQKQYQTIKFNHRAGYLLVTSRQSWSTLFGLLFYGLYEPLCRCPIFTVTIPFSLFWCDKSCLRQRLLFGQRIFGQANFTKKKIWMKNMFLLQRRRQVVAAATFLVWSGGVITKSNWNARACKA